jgi:hypothetical protein
MLDSHALLRHVLILLGAGFLAANVRILVQFVRYLRLRSSAVLTWKGKRPPAYGLFLMMGAVLGLVIIIKLLWLKRPPQEAFGEAMMLLYYGYLVPLSLRIGRGFYQDGVWMDDGFVPYANIGGLSWREDAQGPQGQGSQVTLLLIPRMKRLARRLIVPHEHYGAARRVLRDKIATFDIHFTGKALDLGAHDERDDV